MYLLQLLQPLLQTSRRGISDVAVVALPTLLAQAAAAAHARTRTREGDEHTCCLKAIPFTKGANHKVVKGRGGAGGGGGAAFNEASVIAFVEELCAEAALCVSGRPSVRHRLRGEAKGRKVDWVTGLL